MKDTPLPEFKLDLSTLAAAFAPVRPLRPQRKVVKKVQVRTRADELPLLTHDFKPCCRDTSGLWRHTFCLMLKKCRIDCLQASVPRETKLVITVQRASNLPRRTAAGGGGVRAQSPNRMTGEAAWPDGCTE